MFFCGAFSSEVKFQIKERAENTSELSGQEDRPLQCSHFYHNDKHPNYDEPAMGLLVTDIEHLAYHLKFRKNPKKIGMEKIKNEEAIDSLWKGILSYNNCTMEEIYDRYLDAKYRWKEFFNSVDGFCDHPKSKQIVPPLG